MRKNSPVYPLFKSTAPRRPASAETPLPASVARRALHSPRLATCALTGTLLSAAALVGGRATASPLIPPWARGAGQTTYQEWDVFTSPTGPNPPNAPPAYTTVDAAPFNPNGTATVADSSGGSFVTGGGNIYSFSAPTHIVATVPGYAHTSDFVTTVLVQTRTLGTEPVYTGPGGFRLSYTDAGGSHTLLPARSAELARLALGGFGGDQVDYAAAFEVPASPDSLTLAFDASDASMSLDRLAVDTITTPAAQGFVPVAVPEPATVAALALAACAAATRRRRRRTP